MSGRTRFIPLTQDKFALVNAEDFEWLSQFKWYYNARLGYAMRNGSRRVGRPAVYMHRELCSPGQNMQVDHINGNKLDNRRSNLRAATDQQNKFNLPARKATSVYKGVHWSKQKQKWRVSIKRDGKEKHVGFFDDEQSAAIAYNRAAQELFGPYARLNQL